MGEVIHREVLLGLLLFYSQREVCVRFWVNLYTEESLCKVLGELEESLYIGFWMRLYTEGSYC